MRMAGFSSIAFVAALAACQADAGEGAAGTQANFPYSVTTPDFSEIRKGKSLSEAKQKEGGNE